MRALRLLLWLAIAVVGGLAFFAVAVARGEPVSAAHLLLAAISTFAIGYRFYSRFIARRVLKLDAARPTPAVTLNDGRDYVPTNRWVVFGHHFAAIAGPGPLIGPVLASQFGFLPGAIWILVGGVLAGAVQDFVVLVCSMRSGGRSLAKLARDNLGPVGAIAGTVGILLIMVILIAVLAVVVINALAESPWGLFTVGATIPIAFLMGGIMRGGHGREVSIATAIGVALLLVALFGGYYVSAHPELGPAFTWGKLGLAWAIIGYGLAASILPVWLLLAPRDYLSTFVKLGTVFILAGGILAVRPELRLPHLTQFGDGSGPIFGGKIFPFCFITIACGAISGFHALIASGTTPRLIEREPDARMIGYGGMLLESFVAIMALIAAASLPPGEYLAINTANPPGRYGATDPVTLTRWITDQGFPVTTEQMQELADRVGEKTIIARTGGAPCLAVGMAEIFRRILGGERLAALWYHFAIMFEALFILTTLDAGTRVGRFLLQDGLARLFPRIAGASYGANVLTSVIFVAAWGYFVIAGVTDPTGGIRALWPLFGIANQLLAATALTIATTILARTGRARYAFVTTIPLVFLLAVTVTAGLQYVFHEDPRVGFLAKAAALESGEIPADSRTLGAQVFNARLDATMAGIFVLLVVTVVLSAARQWVRLARPTLPIEPKVPPTGHAGGGGDDRPAFGDIPRSAGGPRCC